jgi:hypothetical protein
MQQRNEFASNGAGHNAKRLRRHGHSTRKGEASDSLLNSYATVARTAIKVDRSAFDELAAPVSNEFSNSEFHAR